MGGLCNCGVEMPKGYRLTEAQFVQNVWLTIHTPAFEEYLRETAAQFMAGVDKEKKGYLTKEDGKEITPKIMKECHPKTKEIFDALDEEKTGHITLEDILKAQRFFFTDTEDEDHVFNYVRGPLVN